MSKYSKNAEEFNKALAQAKATGEPVITAVQKKKEIPLKDYQIDILESIKAMDKCVGIISLKKSRNTSGSHIIYMDHVGKKLAIKNK